MGTSEEDNSWILLLIIAYQSHNNKIDLELHPERSRGPIT